MTKLKDELGRTMLEMLGVLAIMGVIVYGAIAGIQFGVDMYNISAAYNELEELSQGITDLYSWNRIYPEPNKMGSAVASNNIIDSEYEDQGQFQGRFSGSHIKLGRTDDGAGFFIAYMGIPRAEYCSRLRYMDYAHLRVVDENGKVKIGIGEGGVAETVEPDLIDGRYKTDCESGVLVLVSR